MTNTSFRKLMAKTATATVSAAILGQLLVAPAYAAETNSELSNNVAV